MWISGLRVYLVTNFSSASICATMVLVMSPKFSGRYELFVVHVLSPWSVCMLLVVNVAPATNWSKIFPGIMLGIQFLSRVSLRVLRVIPWYINPVGLIYIYLHI